jgi:hypothetical protein
VRPRAGRGERRALTALARYAAGHHHAMLAAAWLEGSGTLPYVIFVLALVHLAGTRAGFAGRVTTLAAAPVLAVSLVYDVMLTAIAQSAALGGQQTATALVAYGHFAAVGHVFVLAPPLFLPLGLILLRSPVLPRVFAPARRGVRCRRPDLGPDRVVHRHRQQQRRRWRSDQHASRHAGPVDHHRLGDPAAAQAAGRGRPCPLVTPAKHPNPVSPQS